MRLERASSLVHRLHPGPKPFWARHHGMIPSTPLAGSAGSEEARDICASTPRNATIEPAMASAGLFAPEPAFPTAIRVSAYQKSGSKSNVADFTQSCCSQTRHAALRAYLSSTRAPGACHEASASITRLFDRIGFTTQSSQREQNCVRTSRGSDVSKAHHSCRWPMVAPAAAMVEVRPNTVERKGPLSERSSRVDDA